MPTYEWKCGACGAQWGVMLSMREYCAAPPQPVCCARPMDRFFSVAPGLALHNVLVSDRAYEGLRTLDGVDVSTRTKHRAYMKERGLTTADDYAGEWARAARQRAENPAADPARREDIARAIAKLENGST